MHFRKHHEVTIYVSPNSANCDLAKTYFRNAGIEFEELDIEKNKTAKTSLLDLSGDTITPVVIIDGRMIIGFHTDVYNLILEGKSDEL